MLNYTKTIASSTLLASIFLVTISCSSNSEVARLSVTTGTVIEGVTVVDTRDGSLKPGHSVVIKDGKIVAVAPANTIQFSGTAQKVDATGKFIVPGYLDMHAHAMAQIDKQPSYFPLMLANGITGFREMGAFPGQFPDMVKRARQLNADIASGQVNAPEALLVPGDIFAATTSVTAAVQGVDRQKGEGVDFIKVISATREAMLAFLSEAKKQGLYVAGHLTPALSAAESSQAGWKSIEHLGSGIGILLDCAADEANLRQAILNRAGAEAPAFPADSASLQQVANTYSEEKCQSLARIFVQNGTWHVPTLRRVHALDASDDKTFLDDPNLIYVDKARIAQWNQIENTFLKLPEVTKSSFRQVFSRKQSVTKLLKQSGVKMMAGSDTGVASIWVIPGFGLHEEFKELAAAGLSPLEILQMTTLNGAEFLNRQATMGSVEAGKIADLVLLDANPIDDAGNLSKIAGIFIKGKYLPKDALDKLKSDTATAYKNAPAPVITQAAVQGHVD